RDQGSGFTLVEAKRHVEVHHEGEVAIHDTRTKLTSNAEQIIDILNDCAIEKPHESYVTNSAQRLRKSCPAQRPHGDAQPRGSVYPKLVPSAGEGRKKVARRVQGEIHGRAEVEGNAVERRVAELLPDAEGGSVKNRHAEGRIELVTIKE